MIKVNVVNSNNDVFSGTFPDSGSANAWISEGTSGNWWGLPATAAIPASYSGVPAGCSTLISISANTPGATGNVSISFNGTSELSAIVASFNSANPSNQITLTGDSSQVPRSGSISLVNGANAVAAGYTIAQSDVTAQYALQQATVQALKNQSIGATIVATVAATNESKLAAQTMSEQTFTTLLADQNVANIERLLWNGSLVTAKSLIQSSNLSAYYTSDEIASILAMFPA